MIYYIKVPASAYVLDINDDPVLNVEGNKVEVTWENLIRSLFTDARFVQRMDVGSIVDLRKSLLSAKEGETVSVSEEDFKVLADVAKRPVSLKTEFIFTFAPMLKCIYGATTDKP